MGEDQGPKCAVVIHSDVALCDSSHSSACMHGKTPPYTACV
jgi:hypothetical protein